MGRGQIGGRHAQRRGGELGLVEPGRIVEHGRQAPRAVRRRQIRSTTWPADSGSPNTSIVRLRPASLTTLPRGLSRSRSSASDLPHVGLPAVDALDFQGHGHQQRGIPAARARHRFPGGVGPATAAATRRGLVLLPLPRYIGRRIKNDESRIFHCLCSDGRGKVQSAPIPAAKDRPAMSEKLIDLRSDTVTRPTPGMRAAMAEADVGDDVFGEDPTVAALEDRVAALLGKERAIFVPSGTMSNQIGLRLHCSPGDELICEADCHIYNYEQAGYAQFSGLAVRPVAGEEAILRREQLEGLIRGENDHLPRTRLLCLENTHNRGAGRVLPYDGVVDICDWAHAIGLATHLDGARLWNAAVATGIPPADWAQHFDTVSVCFSKGLGAPVGSALAGHARLIKLARRHRKLLGGGMRQAGVLAAAALYALEHHVDRLARRPCPRRLAGRGDCSHRRVWNCLRRRWRPTSSSFASIRGWRPRRSSVPC